MRLPIGALLPSSFVCPSGSIGLIHKGTHHIGHERQSSRSHWPTEFSNRHFTLHGFRIALLHWERLMQQPANYSAVALSVSIADTAAACITNHRTAMLRVA